MSRYIRIIPRLDIKGPNLVKGIHLEGLRVLGNPESFAGQYYEAGACELLYVDVVASLYERNSLDNIISKVAKNTFIPITVAGGIRSIDDIQRILHSGADKVSLNTAAIRNPNLVYDAAKKFGSSTIVVTVEAIKSGDGRYYAFIDNGRESTGVEVFEWVKRIEDMGAGEIIVTSVDREGTGKGFDLDLVGRVADSVKVPVVAHGGAGCIEHVVEVIDKTDVNGVSLASILHYGIIESGLIQYQENQKEGNTAFIEQKRSFKAFSVVMLDELVRQLSARNVICRSK